MDSVFASFAGGVDERRVCVGAVDGRVVVEFGFGVGCSLGNGEGEVGFLVDADDLRGRSCKFVDLETEFRREEGEEFECLERCCL